MVDDSYQDMAFSHIATDWVKLGALSPCNVQPQRLKADCFMVSIRQA